MIKPMSTAFCCTSLKKGTLIVGWFSLIVTVVQLTTVSTLLEMQVKYQAAVGRAYVAKHREGGNTVITSSSYQPDYSTSSYQPDYSSCVMLAVLFAISLVFVIASVCLLYGADKGRRGLLIPYFILFGLTFGLNILSLLFDICGGQTPVPVSARLVYLVIFAYLLTIVGSFYLELRPGNQYVRQPPTVPLNPYPTNQLGELDPANQNVKNHQYAP